MGEKRRKYEQILQDSSSVDPDLEVPLKYNLELHGNKHIQCNGDNIDYINRSTEPVMIDSLNSNISNEQSTTIDSTEIDLAASTIKFISEKINNSNVDDLN